MYSKPNKEIFKREEAIVQVNVLLKKKIETALEEKKVKDIIYGYFGDH